MTNAVIETGGKQYLVTTDEKLAIEKLEAQEGDIVIFDKVLLIDNDSKISIGKPYLTGSKVTAKVLSQGKGEKLTIFKYRAKSRYRRKTGHRQLQTEVQIQSIA